MSTPFKTPAGEILPFRLPKGATYEIKRKDSMPLHLMVTRANGTSYPINLPEGNWKELGTISHKGEFGFDPEPYIEPLEVMDMAIAYYDYVSGEWKPNWMDMVFTPESSFISLIESKGEILWVNPINRPEAGCYSYPALYDVDLENWQSYEAKRVKENELILIIVNR